MTPAEIEAEVFRLQDAWAAALCRTGDHGEAWLAVAEASLRAREDMRAAAARMARAMGTDVVAERIAALPLTKEEP